MDIHTIVFVITSLFIHIDFCSRKSKQQAMNQKDRFKKFFFQGNAAMHSSFHTCKEKNLTFSVGFQTEGARVNLSDLFDMQVFYMGFIKGEFIANFSSYI